jgi:hypothetical protein
MNRNRKTAAIVLGIIFYLVAGGAGGSGNARAGEEPLGSGPVAGTPGSPSPAGEALPPSAALPATEVPGSGSSSQTLGTPAGSGQTPGNAAGSGQGNSGLGPAPVSAPAGGQFEVTVTNGLLSVRLKDADLFEVMKVLSQKTGMRVKVDKGASKKITLTFRDLPFEKGIRNLIRPLNNAMIWKKGKDDHGMDVDILEELHIFREGHQGGETVDYAPEETQPVDEKSTVTKGGWSEETRRRMLEKLTVRPTAP